MDNEWIGQRSTLGLKDRGHRQGLESVSCQPINRFRRHPDNPTPAQEVGTFGHPILSRNNSGA